jgi:hypothetical protein
MAASEKEIQDYIHNRLSDTKQTAFEKQLQDDSDLATEVREAMLIKEGLSIQQEEYLRSRMEFLEREHRNRKSRNQLTWVRWAAAILLLAVPIYYFNSLPTSPDKIYEEYYQPYENVIGATRGDNSSDFMRSYDQGDYEAAVEELQLAVQQSEDQQDYYLYLGISHLELSQYNSALKSFSKIDASNRFSSHGQWYSALANLKLGETEKAMGILSELKENGGSFAERSGEILDALD